MTVRAEPLLRPTSVAPGRMRAAAAAPGVAVLPAAQRLEAFSRSLNARPEAVAQRALGERLAAASVAQRVPVNRTGLPNGLKAGAEALSGLSLDDVRVHRNSPKAAQLRAHAFAQGPDIHLAPGQERHLPHEAWHVVQQKQGRVRPTMQLKGVGINDDAGLEREADVMGARAASETGVAQRMAPSVAQLRAVVQCILVDEDDIGDSFDVTTTGGVRAVGVLEEIRGGGWYRFSVGMVRGSGNIHRRVDDPMDDASDSSDSGADSGQSSDEEMDTGKRTFSGAFTSTHVPTDQNEFTIEDVARANGVSVREALLMIRNSFQVIPRTLRLHYPFGSKTIARGAPAFSTPDESDKLPQAMVSYRQGDYGKHRKVGKDYDDWADELSDDESETTKRQRAADIMEFLDNDPSVTFGDLSSGQKAALGGLLSVGLFSDPLRTEYNSRRTERDLSEQLRARSQGTTTFHQVFGSKTGSTFLPARKGGSAQQREALRGETEKATKELQGEARLWQNNCLINAICQAAHGRNATLPELLAIRFNLDNVGEMMVATQQTVNLIRNALGIDNEVIVRYPVGGVALDETFAGIQPSVVVYHTGADHFQNMRPAFGIYN